MACYQFTETPTRRELLRQSACGFAGLSLAAMAAATARGADATPVPSTDLPVHRPMHHHLPRAKRIIFLFMWGGPSHVDLFDPKPRLNEFAGRAVTPEALNGNQPPAGTILGSPFRYQQHGESGMWISELFPHLARHADRLCVVRSLHTDGSAHGEALLNLHTGHANLVRPSVGAWVSYGLGNEAEDLPAFITISPPRGHGGVQNYGSAFLPAVHQATAIGAAEIPIAKAKIANITNPKWNADTQRQQLDVIQALNQHHLESARTDRGLEGLIDSYELAFRMQTAIPNILSLDDEPQETLELYGVGHDPTDNFARQCLLARKFAERGVRYVQVSTDYTWDHHSKNNEGMVRECAKVDQPIHGLLTDLARRGLLDDTLVVWGAEFGRTPTVENGDGRGHHPSAFTMWLAGGGVRGGLTYGTTDDFGFHPVEQPMHMHDLHATLLHALGLDHTRLTYRHSGRDFRLTDIYGNVHHDLFI